MTLIVLLSTFYASGGSLSVFSMVCGLFRFLHLYLAHSSVGALQEHE